MGAIPLVPRGARGREVLPGDHGPRRTLACRLRRRSRAGPRAGQRRGGGHRPGRGGLRSPVDRGAAARPRPDRARAHAPAAAGTQAGQGAPRVEPPGAGEARHRRAAGPRDGPAQGLGGEGQHGHRAPVRRDQGRGPQDQEHDPVPEGHPGEPGPQRPAKSRAQPGHPAVWVGAAGTPPGAESSRPGGEDQTRVHEPALLGVRAGGRDVARESSRLPVHRLRIRLQR